MERGSFTFKKEWRDAVCALPKQVRAEVYDAIIEYGITGEAPKLKTMARTAFAFAKAEMDAMENAAKGNGNKTRRGAPKGNQNASKHKREKPAAPAGTGQPPVYREVDEMSSDKAWVETVCMLTHTSPGQLEPYFSRFRLECETSGKLCHDGMNDAKQHFKNWLRIQLQKKQQYEQTENQRATRRRTDVPDAGTTDYHSAF